MSNGLDVNILPNNNASLLVDKSSANLCEKYIAHYPSYRLKDDLVLFIISYIVLFV